MPPLRFISYTRVSTDDQADYGTGLETQEKENAEYVRRHTRQMEPAEVVARMGAILVGVESDPGISGTIYPREGLERALERLQWGEADALIVHRIDRLGRRLWIPPVVLERLHSMGKRLFSAEDGEATEENIILFALRCGIAQTDHSGIVKRLHGGHRRMAEKGLMPNRAQSPYGYHVVQKIEGGIVQPDAGTYRVVESEAAVVRRMFDLYASGGSLLGIAKQFQREGVPTRTGVAWYPQIITKILHSPFYKGEGAWGRTVVKTKPRNQLTKEESSKCWGKGLRKQMISKAPDERRVTFHVPAIVSAELWQRVQELLVENGLSGGTRLDRLHLFAGLLHCPTCGRRCNISSTPTGVRYKCRQATPTMSASGFVCNSKTYRERDILAAVRRVFERLSRDPGILSTLREKQRKAHGQAFDVKAYNAIVKELAELDKRESAVNDMALELRMEGTPMKDQKERLEDIAGKRRAAEARRVGLEKTRNPENALDGATLGKLAQDAAQTVLEVLDSEMSDTGKNQVLRQIIKEIWPHEGGFRVLLRIAESTYL